MPTDTAPIQMTASVITSGAEAAWAITVPRKYLLNDALPPNHGQI